MYVVHTPSPWAMVASRWTWVPSSGRRPPSPPRTAAGTPRPRAPPGSGAGRAARRRRSCDALAAYPSAVSAPASASARASGSGRRPPWRPGTAPPARRPARRRTPRSPRGRHAGDPAQRGGREPVVGVPPHRRAGVGQREDLRGTARPRRPAPAAPARPRRHRRPSRRGADGPPRAQPQLGAELSRGTGTPFEENPGDPIPSAAVGGGCRRRARAGGRSAPRPGLGKHRLVFHYAHVT